MEIRITITPQELGLKTLADVDDGVVCIDKDGDLTWKDGSTAVYVKNGYIPRIRITNPSGIKITKVLGKIKFAWDAE